MRDAAGPSRAQKALSQSGDGGYGDWGNIREDPGNVLYLSSPNIFSILAVPREYDEVSDNEDS